MFPAILALASESAESSKTAFYVGGGVLAGWAVIVSVIGMTQPDFPKSDGASRGVMGIGLVLTVVAMATVLLTA